MRVLRIATDGSVTSVDLIEGGRTVSQGLYSELECRAFGLVTLPDGHGQVIDLWVDEEGLYTTAINTVATAVAKHLEPRIAQPLFGHVVLTSSDDVETVALTDSQMVTVLHAIPITNRGDALHAVPDSQTRVNALRPATECGPGYRRRVVDELHRARHMWEVDAAGACLVAAEIAAGFRPESDYPDRHDPALYASAPTVSSR
ncbi:hypothetical protein ABIE52_006741 [Rhodococcus sp. OAS809]|uniref:hypothetical protein n=1 Tax=Rhodococcus sp. OAS809 TaxID=2663874 RepID=UPI00178B53BA